MSDMIPVETFRRELFDLLEETFEKTQGIYLDRGGSLLETLARLTASQASHAVSPKGATIAGHVEHMIFYLGVLTDCIQRKPIGELNWRDSWRTSTVTPAEWDALRAGLREAYDDALNVMRGVESWEGEDDIGASLAILAHSASHLGAIHQALHGLPPPNG